MFSKIKEIFFGKPVVAEAPYKVETSSVVALGEPPATVVVEGAGVVSVPVVAELPLVQLEQVSSPAPAEVAPKTAPVKKAPAKTAKTAVKAAPKKAGRKPKAK
jgi:hypothetical protein